MKTKVEIIKETAEFYNLTNRGYYYGSGSCLYLTPEGTMCAVGRCIKEDEIKSFDCRFDTGVSGVEIALEKNNETLDQYLKPEYQGHSVNFWDDLQKLHDTSSNWDATGLTLKGEQVYEFLLKKYED